MKKIMTATAAAAAFIGVAFADVFPDADGSHDFTSLTAWNVSALPDAASFGSDADGATYNAATDDASFTTFTLLSGLRTFDLSATPTRKITFAAAVNADAFVVEGDSTNEIKGGFWNFKNKSHLVFRSSSGATRNVNLAISGGAILTNVANVTVAGSLEASNRLVIFEGAAVYSDISSTAESNQCMKFGTYWGDGNGKTDGSSVEILSGGKFVGSGGYWWLYSGSASKGMRSDFTLRVSGEGSLFQTLGSVGSLYMGGGNMSGDRIIVEDGATFKLGGGMSFGYSADANDMRVIVDNATFAASTDVNVNDRATNHDDDNVMEIRNGATATVSGNVFVGARGVNGALVLSNATLTCLMVQVGNNATSATNRFVMCGKDAKLNYTRTSALPFFGTGRDNRFELKDGAEFRYDAERLYLAIGGAATNCVLSVSDGAALRSTKAIHVGYNAGELGNRLEVGAGGTVEVASVDIQKAGQSVIVSNGTLVCTTGRVRLHGEGGAFTLQGANAVYRQDAADAAGGTYCLFGASSCVSNNTWNVLDGATFAYGTNGGAVYMGVVDAGVYGNVLNVARGGTFRASDGFYVGYTGDSCNTVNVYDGGVLDVAALHISSKHQSVVVSNGTVTVSGDLVFGHWKDTIMNEDCRLVIAGTNSSVAVKGSLYLLNTVTRATLAFVVPVDGYAKTPLTTNRINLNDDSSVLEIDAMAFQAGLGNTANVTLAEATTSLSIPDAVLAATNEKLAAQRMSVCVVGGTKLVLKVRPKPRGACIIIR